jgi:hypothetical protein
MSAGGRQDAHFPLEKWVDFARGLVGEGERKLMQNHLDTGCRKCSEALAFSARVYRAAQRESNYEPPADAVRIVKAAFSKAQTEPTGTFLAAELLFDSFLNPLPSGVRSTPNASRQLLFGAGRYRIDVRLEPHIESDQVAVVGQLLNTAHEPRGIERARVRLVKGRKVVAETVTSRFGEFHLNCDQGLELHVLPELGEEIVIPLVEPNAGAIRKARPATRKRNSAKSRSTKV